MGIEFSKGYKDAQREFVATLNNPDLTNEERVEAFATLNEALKDEVLREANEEASQLLNAQRITKDFTNEEVKFFSNLATPEANTGMEDEKLLPQETVNRVFEDMKQNHPLLEVIGLTPSMMRTKVLISQTSGVAEWGEIYDDIKGQLKAAFTEEEFTQNKMTAFVVVPKDILKLGPSWIETFTRLQMVEAFSCLLEAAFINGDGKNKPIGLMRDVHKGVSVSDGVYPEKASEGTLDLTDSKAIYQQFAKVMTKLRFKEDGKTLRATTGKVYLLVSGCDYLSLKATFTNLNANGVYIEALPLGVELIESAFVEAGKAIFFLPDWYDAFTGSTLEFSTSDDVAFFQDWRVYAAKWFAYGKARDNNVSVVYDLPESIHTADDTKAKTSAAKAKSK